MEADVQSDVHKNLGNVNQEIHQISESFQHSEISDCKVLSSSIKLVTENKEFSKDNANDYPSNKDAKDGDGDVLNDKSDLSSPHVVVKVPDRTGKSSQQIFDYIGVCVCVYRAWWGCPENLYRFQGKQIQFYIYCRAGHVLSFF